MHLTPQRDKFCHCNRSGDGKVVMVTVTTTRYLAITTTGSNYPTAQC